ncbi:hypothetical protein AB0K09_25270 [Streptomyces sp. NPDC049577]
MDWWAWLVIVVVGVLAVAGTAAGVQARRRSGTVIAVRRGRGPGRRAVR